MSWGSGLVHTLQRRAAGQRARVRLGRIVRAIATSSSVASQATPVTEEQLAPLAKAFRERLELRLGATDEGRMLSPATLRPGAARWMRWLARSTETGPVDHEEAELLAHAARWREGVHALVGRTCGFLQIAALYWKHDQEGRELARAVAARRRRWGHSLGRWHAPTAGG